jgi:phosphoglycolate phosphatase-like HAD superfamily hydrolase
LRKTSFDVLCHHGAQVGDYRSADFDPYQAAATNLHCLPDVLKALKDPGFGRLVLTAASSSRTRVLLHAFKICGLCKGPTAAAAAFHADHEVSLSRSS